VFDAKMKISAIVPMRHNSERVPAKNYRMFAGKPLFHHILQVLIKANVFEEVVIDTDSPFIIQDATKSFPEVKILERPENLRDGSIPMNHVLMHTISQLQGDHFFQTHSTNPLLSVDSVRLAVAQYFASLPGRNSLFSVTRLSTRLWDQLTRPLNHNPAILQRTQDMPAVFEENSCIFVFSRAVLERTLNRIGERPLMLELPQRETHDIDTEEDFIVAEILFDRNYGANSEIKE
jgi:CMP-N-acetylneuraminic acid synthetase